MDITPYRQRMIFQKVSKHLLSGCLVIGFLPQLQKPCRHTKTDCFIRKLQMIFFPGNSTQNSIYKAF